MTLEHFTGEMLYTGHAGAWTVANEAWAKFIFAGHAECGVSKVICSKARVRQFPPAQPDIHKEKNR